MGTWYTDLRRLGREHGEDPSEWLENHRVAAFVILVCAAPLFFVLGLAAWLEARREGASSSDSREGASRGT